MIYELPTAVTVNETEYEIRSDYRAVLDICIALNDIELLPEERIYIALAIFYPTFNEMPVDDYEEAVKACFKFIDGGEERNAAKAPKLVDWEQDFKYIVAPINRAAGEEIRSIKYLHWWSFLSYYMDIGDCLFAQIVRIRQKKAKGEKLDKVEQKWYRQNRELVDFKTTYTSAEDALIKEWTEF